MEEFARSVNEFLEFRKYDILKDNGKISSRNKKVGRKEMSLYIITTKLGQPFIYERRN